MAISNYWLLIIWIFAVGIIGLIIPKKEEVVLGKLHFRWRFWPAYFLMLPYCIWAGWRKGSWGDTGAYQRMFSYAPSHLSDIWDFALNSSKDKGFAFLEGLFKSLISEKCELFFFAVALFCMFGLVKIYRKYSEDFWLSMFFFIVCGEYMSWFHNGMRQFIAVIMIFLCFPFLYRKKYLPILLVIVIAAQIHASALFALPFVFIVQGKPFNWKTLLFIFSIAIIILFVDRFTGAVTGFFDDSAYSGEVQEFAKDTGTNILRVLFYTFPTVVAFIFRKRILEAGNPLMNICVNLSIASAGFYILSFFTSGIFMGRIPIYFSLANYIMIPWMVTRFFTRDSARLIKVALVGVYLVFFYFQHQIAWGLL